MSWWHGWLAFPSNCAQYARLRQLLAPTPHTRTTAASYRRKSHLEQAVGCLTRPACNSASDQTYINPCKIQHLVLVLCFMTSWAMITDKWPLIVSFEPCRAHRLPGSKQTCLGKLGCVLVRRPTDCEASQSSPWGAPWELKTCFRRQFSLAQTPWDWKSHA